MTSSDEKIVLLLTVFQFIICTFIKFSCLNFLSPVVCFDSSEGVTMELHKIHLFLFGMIIRHETCVTLSDKFWSWFGRFSVNADRIVPKRNILLVVFQGYSHQLKCNVIAFSKYSDKDRKCRPFMSYEFVAVVWNQTC